MADEETQKVLKEILVWTRVGFYSAAEGMLAKVLNTDKKKLAYQAMDGARTVESIRTELKMSPNDLSELTKQCVNLGLMELLEGNKKKRLFDLTNFGLLPENLPAVKEAKNE